jgi:hypothetical protein
MKMFGRKVPELTDEDRAAAVRLSALAARLKPETSPDFTDVSPDPLGEPEGAQEPEAAQELEGPGDSREPDSDE